MFRSILRAAPVALTAVSALALAGVPAAQAHQGSVTVCNGGPIASGDYYELVVQGNCSVPDGADVTVETQLYVNSGSALDAVTASHLHVKGNLQVGWGAVLGLGCGAETKCSGPSTDEVDGNVNSDHATAVVLHNDTVKGDITTLNDGPGVNCDSGAFTGKVAAFGMAPAYDAFEDSTVGGYITTSGLRSCWAGTIRNHVGTNILVSDDRTADPDGNEVVANTVKGDLGCYSDSPAAHSTEPNTVNGTKLGECAVL